MTAVDVSRDKTGMAGQVGAKAKAVPNREGDARKTLLWFVILCVTLWVWSLTAPSAYARGVPENLADLNEAYAPAVVNITTDKIEDEAAAPQGDSASPFEELFDDFRKTPTGPRHTLTQGSGFIIDSKGIVVTNFHVIDGSAEIEVTLSDGRSFEADVIGKDEKTDLAVLQIKTRETLPSLEFADSDTARVGDWVMAIGNPFGLGGSVSAGIISARNRDFESGGPYANYIQTDAAINQGNSGGPLFDMAGRVVGVNTAIFSTGGGSIGIGFAIPSNQARKIVDELIENGEVRRGWLGVRVQEMTGDIAESLGLDRPRGALVSEVNPEGPAFKAGFEPGDLIMTFNGHTITAMRDLPRAVAEAKIGTTAKVSILRNERPETLKVRIVEKEKRPVVVAAAEVQKPKVQAAAEALGLQLANLDDKARARFGIEESVQGVVVVGVDPASAAWGRVRPGDVIQAVSQQQVASPKAVVQRINDVTATSSERPVLLMIHRDGNRAFVAVSAG